MTQFFRRYHRSLLWAVFILLLCGIPGKHIPEPDFWRWLKWDKVTHVILFGVLSFLMLKESCSPDTVVRVWIILLLAGGYGAGIEWLQAHVFIDRSGDVRDAAANVVGAFAGWGAHRWSKRKSYR
ncbi:MAG: VanZ family protein [Bacteroidota bacterium]